MTIAILLSTYNGELYISKLFESLKKQTLSQYINIYIRDDGSSDNTINIINSWKNELNIVLYKGSNIGPSKSFWELLKNEKIVADFYFFCDQDDIWDPLKVEESLKLLKDDTHLVFCNCRLIDFEGILIKDLYLTSKPTINLQRLFISGIAQGCSMAFTKELRDWIISLDITCIPMHDWILMIYAKEYGKIQYINTPLFDYRIHSNNAVAKNKKNSPKSILRTLNKWRKSRSLSMSCVAHELLENCNTLSKEDIQYLTVVENYKTNLIYKKKLLFGQTFKNIDRRTKMSYQIRVLLNIY